jgi:hypothetical protein
MSSTHHAILSLPNTQLFDLKPACSSDQELLPDRTFRSIRSIRDEWEVRAVTDSTWAGSVDFTEQAPAAQAHTHQKLHSAPGGPAITVPEDLASLPAHISPVVRTRRTTLEQRLQVSSAFDRADITARDAAKGQHSHRQSHGHNRSDMPSSPAAPNAPKGRAAEVGQEKSMRIGSKIMTSGAAKPTDGQSGPNSPTRKQASAATDPPRPLGALESTSAALGPAATKIQAAAVDASAGGNSQGLSPPVAPVTAATSSNVRGRPSQQGANDSKVASDAVHPAAVQVVSTPSSLQPGQSCIMQDAPEPTSVRALLQARILDKTVFIEPPAPCSDCAEAERSLNEGVIQLHQTQTPDPVARGPDMSHAEPIHKQPGLHAPKGDPNNSSDKLHNRQQLPKAQVTDSAPQSRASVAVKTGVGSPSQADRSSASLVGSHRPASHGPAKAAGAGIDGQMHLDQEKMREMDVPQWMDATMGDLSHSMAASAGNSSMHALTSTIGSSTAGKSSIYDLTNPSAV